MTKPLAAKILLSLATLFCLLPLVALADDPPSVAEMWLFTPKQGESAELAEAVRAHGVFRNEHGDPRAWQVYTPVLGDEMGRVGVRYCCLNWADVDAYQAWESANPTVSRHYLETVEPHVASTAHFFETLDWENSHWNQEAGPFRLFAVTEFTLKVGHGAQFDAARDKMSQIAIEQGWAEKGNTWLWASVIGGAPTEAIIIPYRDFADLGATREQFAQFLSQQLGAEAASEVLQQMQDAVSGVDYQIWEHRPELSMPTSD